MADFEFKDNSAAVKGALREAAIAFLNEVGGEVASRTKQNSRRKTGKTAGSWTYQVDESGYKVAIGSGEENAVWDKMS